MHNTIYLDTETTGLDAKKHDIIEFAYILESPDGTEIATDVFTMQPFSLDTVNPKALQVTGRKSIDLLSYEAPAAAWNRFLVKIKPYCPLRVVGYNVGFDIDFIRQHLIKCHSSPYWTYFDPYVFIDVRSFVMFLAYKGKLMLPNYKLATVCKYYGITLDVHKADSDIRATKELFTKINTFITWGKEEHDA